MKFHVARDYPKNLDAIVVRLYEDEKKIAHESAAIKPALAKIINEEVKRSGFKGNKGSTLVVSLPPTSVAAHAIVAGLGKPDFALETFRRTMAAVVLAAASRKFSSIGTPVPGNKLDPEQAAQANTEGALLASYDFTKYRKSERPAGFSLTYVTGDRTLAKPIKEGIRRAETIATAVYAGRDLVNEPPSTMTPVALAAAARKLVRGRGVRATVLDQRQVKRLGMDAFLAVSRGSDQPPRLIRLQYNPPRAKKRVVIVGKGITFDSGGINLKPSRGGSLEDMKMDMAGGAAVIAVMSALKALGIKHRVTAYVAATENLLGGSAYKPGDVVRAHNGKTIEVMNTDAEGRLTLADVLSYSERRDKPDAIIDLATLTATEVSLGLDYAALFGDESLTNELQAAGEVSGERVWPFPLPEEYQETVKGRIADLRNTGTDRGYSINGAVFLRNFVDKAPWAHIDIGSPASSDKDRGYLKRGGTGFGIRLILEYLSTTRA